MTLATNALTTLATALDELALTSDGGAQDARIERYINEASDLLEAWCARRFYRASDHVERVPGRGHDLLKVYAHVPIESISSIVFSHGSDSTTINADDYAIEEVGDGRREVAGRIRRNSGVWGDTRDVSMGITARRVAGSHRNDYVITYTGGWITPKQDDDGVGDRTLPRDIEAAVLDFVKMRNAQRAVDPTVTSIGMMDGSISYAEVGGVRVPHSVAAVVDRYGRVVAA